MLGGIIPHPPRRRKNTNWWVYTKNIEIAKWTKIDIALRINSRCKAYGPGGNSGI